MFISKEEDHNFKIIFALIIFVSPYVTYSTTVVLRTNCEYCKKREEETTIP